MVRWLGRLASLVVAAAVAGCGAAVPPGAPPGEQPGEPSWVEPTCPPDAGFGPMPGGEPEPPRGSIPDDFATAWVLRCRSEQRDLPGRGTWRVQVTERADTGFADLVELLRGPSDPMSSGPCTLELRMPPFFLLVDASGRALLPAVPTDSCGKPRLEVDRLLAELPFRIMSETPVREVRSQKSTESECPDAWKDLFAVEAGTAEAAPARPLWKDPVGQLRLCIYDQVPGGNDVPGGRLRSGRTLTRGDTEPLLAALDRAGPAADCAAPHTSFAVLHLVAEPAMAELDGCRRLLRPDHTLGQLDEATVATLLRP